MTLFRLIIWRHLFGEPLRTGLTVTGVGLGVAVYVAVATANVAVLQSFEKAIIGIAGHTTLQINSAAALPDGFDETIIGTVRQANGVVLAAPVLEITAIWRFGSRSPVVLPILGVDLLAESAVRDYAITSTPSPSVDGEGDGTDWERYLEPDAIFLGRGFATRNGLSVGQSLDVQVGSLNRRVVVRGIIEGHGAGRTALEELAVMDIAAAQFTFERLGRLDRIDIVSAPSRSVEDLASELRAKLPFGLIVKRPEQRNAQMERMTRAFRLNVASLSVVALLVGLFLVYNTMSFAVVRRRREIGILRSLGMLPAGVGWLFLIEGLILGVIGWILGLLGGVFLAQAAVRMMATTSGNLYEVTVHPGMLTISGAVVAQSFLIGIGVALVGSIGPIREASAVRPVQALAPKGYEVSKAVPIASTLLKVGAILVLAGLAALPGPVNGVPVFGYLAAFLLIAAFALLSPVAIHILGSSVRAIIPLGWGYLPRIAAGELERAPVRNAVAVSALMMGLALMLGMMILIHSFRQTVDLWLDQTVKADVIVAAPTWLGSGPPSLLPESVRQRLLDVPGVAAADAYRDVRMEFRDRSIAVVARDLLVHARYSRYLFLEGDSRTVLADAVRNRQVVVSEAFANQFALRRGDSVTLPSPQGPVALTIAGVFYDYATDGGKIVMDRALYEPLWQDRNLSVVPLYLVPGTDPEKIRREVGMRLGGDPPVLVITNAELKQEVLRIFDQTFAVTYALELIAVFVALLGVINALLSGILERQSDLAVMRAMGGTPRQIGQLILCESGLLGVAGIILGVAAGLVLSVLLIEVINKQSFGWSVVFYFDPPALLKVAGLALLTTLAAGYGPARRAANLPVAETLHYE